ncbi:MAG: deoxynucleoside kinase [Chloroflexota bacterium]
MVIPFAGFLSGPPCPATSGLLAEGPTPAIGDRSIYEDAYIFARVLRHMGNISERDYESYHTVFNLIAANLPRPDLLIYLTAPVSVLHERIRRRARTIEESISTDYLSLLGTFYDEWLADFDLCPVLTIRTQQLDFVHKPEHLDTVVQRVTDRLSGKDELILD